MGNIFLNFFKPSELDVYVDTCFILLVNHTVHCSPLDEMIDELGGPSCVAEMTGRKGFIGRYRKDQKPKYIPRTSGSSAGTDSISVKEVCSIS